MNTSNQNPRFATIAARTPWNVTDILLEAGKTYDFLAEGQWLDASIECTADGYPPPNLNPWQKVLLRAFAPLRRVRSAKWFVLIGTIDQDMDTAFLIGRTSRHTMEKTGTLTCFANDVGFMYCNNSGAVTLSVTAVDEIR